jgi:hypothetical protein
MDRNMALIPLSEAIRVGRSDNVTIGPFEVVFHQTFPVKPNSVYASVQYLAIRIGWNLVHDYVTSYI